MTIAVICPVIFPFTHAQFAHTWLKYLYVMCSITEDRVLCCEI